MGDAWFTGCADELARLLVDARACADACELHLATAPEAIGALAAPVAVSQVLFDLLDQPPQLVLAAARLCRELSLAAAQELGGPPEVVDALQRLAASADALLGSAR